MSVDPGSYAGSAEMDAAGVGDAVLRWISPMRGVGLMLPGGWFGRPHDNLHQLTWLETRGISLIIELDDRLLLVFMKPRIAEVDDAQLAISSPQIAFLWQEFGAEGTHSEVFAASQVTLISSGPRTQKAET